MKAVIWAVAAGLAIFNSALLYWAVPSTVGYAPDVLAQLPDGAMVGIVVWALVWVASAVAFALLGVRFASQPTDWRLENRLRWWRLTRTALAVAGFTQLTAVLAGIPVDLALAKLPPFEFVTNLVWILAPVGALFVIVGVLMTVSAALSGRPAVQAAT